MSQRPPYKFQSDTVVVKALSVKQPWANLIASGKKTIETRTWQTKHYGALLIVSSKRPAINPAGCAVAIASLTCCWPMSELDEERAMCSVYEGAFSWVLSGIVKIEPFPVSGSLRLFDVAIPRSVFLEWAKP